MSIKKQLLVYLTLLLGGFWLASALISRNVIVQEIDEIINNDLSLSAVRLMPLVVREINGAASRQVIPRASDSGGQGTDSETDQGQDAGQDAGQDSGQSEEHELVEEAQFFTAAQDGYLAYRVLAPDGHVVLRSYDAPEFDFPQTPRPGFQSGDENRTYTIIDRDSGLTLTVLMPDEHRDEAVNEATTVLFTPLGLMIPLLILAILYLVRLMIRPIAQLRREISARGGSNYDPIAAEDYPQELRPIASAVDRLLERLRAAMEAERSFAANAAHELRTPIAGALAQTQRLKAELEGAGQARRVDEVEKTLKNLSDFTDKLLQLSKIEAQPDLHKSRENMSPVMDMVLREFRERTTDPVDIRLENNLNQDLILAMDPDTFAIVLRNLIENAAIHGTPGTPVEVRIEPDWSIHVVNECDPVAPEVLRDLTGRFNRGATDAKGAGLGLSIVDRIITNAGGTLTLHSPATGRTSGFEAVVQLP